MPPGRTAPGLKPVFEVSAPTILADEAVHNISS
jgi:hypothetical protein